MYQQGVVGPCASARASKPGRPRGGDARGPAARHTPERLLDYPRIGEKLESYVPREVLRIIVGNYEMSYEIAAGTIFILRLWHCRENRSFESEE